MSKRIRVGRWNMSTFEAIRRSAGVEALVTKHASQIAGRAGTGVKHSVMQGKTRVRGMVYTDTFHARVRNARDNTLLKALGS